MLNVNKNLQKLTHAFTSILPSDTHILDTYVLLHFCSNLLSPFMQAPKLIVVLFSTRITHYEQRLRTLYYVKRFPERMGEIKPKVKGIPFISLLFNYLCIHLFVYLSCPFISLISLILHISLISFILLLQ